MMSTIPFYYITLQEYYMGHLVLPQFSGPDDTSLAISGICFFTAYRGTQMWAQEIDLFGFGTGRLAPTVLFMIFAFEVILSLFSVSSTLYENRNNTTFKKRFRIGSFIAHISYMVVNVLIYLSYT